MRICCLLTVALAAGCGPGTTLSATLDLADDPMVSALSPDAALIGGGDGALLTRLGLTHPAVPNQAIEIARFGCAPAGCVALAAGEFGALDMPSLQAELNPGPGGAALVVQHGVDLVSPSGQVVALRRLSDQKMAMGDRAAMAELADQPSGYAPSALNGLVPTGSAWLAAPDVSAAATLTRSRLTALDPALAQLITDRLDQLPPNLTGVAVSIDDDDGQAWVRARARFASTADAESAARQLWWALRQSAPEDTEPWQAAMWDAATVSQSAEWVELVSAVPTASLPELRP